MEFHEMFNEPHHGAQPPVSGNPGGNSDAVRQAGEELFRHADDAIDRALSNNSEVFLDSTQQHGGQ